MSEEAFKVWQLGVAAWCKFVSGVMHEQEASGVRDGLAGDGVFHGVRDDSLDRGADTMMTERYGISRHARQPENVLEVDFEHFRTVRDVRRSLYGDRRSPLAGREVKP
jgi:hypothetical protein